MRIGEVAAASGVTAKMIRYYEEIGLVPSVQRRESGYRLYEPSDVHRLRFIHRARELGFSIQRIRELLRLWNDRRRPSREVKSIALAHIAEMEAQIARMRQLLGTLRHLANSCDGDARPHCPILDELAHAGEGTAHQRPEQGAAA